MYYDFEKIKMYIIGIGIGLAVLMSLWFQSEKENIKEDMKDYRGGVKWTAEAGQRAADTFESALDDIKKSFDEYDYAKASDQYRDASYEIERWTMNHGYRELESGQTLREWHDAIIKDFHTNELIKAAHTLIARLAIGEGSYTDYKTLSHSFSGAHRYQIDKLFRENRVSIDKARAELAGNWIRLEVSATYNIYEKIAIEAIVSSWPEDSPLKLVVGKAFGPAEREATLKTFKISITEETALYQSKDIKKDGFREMAQIPSKVKVNFKMENSRKLPAIKSSLDDLEPIQLQTELPEEYFAQLKHENQRVGFEEEIKKQRAILGKKLNEALTGLPRFSVTDL